MIITRHMQKIIQIHPCLLKLSRKQESVTDGRPLLLYPPPLSRGDNNHWSWWYRPPSTYRYVISAYYHCRLWDRPPSTNVNSAYYNWSWWYRSPFTYAINHYYNWSWWYRPPFTYVITTYNHWSLWDRVTSMHCVLDTTLCYSLSITPYRFSMGVPIYFISKTDIHAKYWNIVQSVVKSSISFFYSRDLCSKLESC